MRSSGDAHVVAGGLNWRRTISVLLRQTLGKAHFKERRPVNMIKLSRDKSDVEKFRTAFKHHVDVLLSFA